MPKSNLSDYLDYETGMAYTYDRDKVKHYFHQHGWPTEFGFRLALQLGLFAPDADIDRSEQAELSGWNAGSRFNAKDSE